MRIAFLPLLLLASVSTPALAQGAVTGSAPAISVDTLKTVTKELSSDAYEGRAPTTPAEDKTVAYIVDRFKQAGLKPGNPEARAGPAGSRTCRWSRSPRATSSR